MLSVKERIKSITQPRFGYLPRESFQVITYDDGLSVNTSSPSYLAYATIQGSAVDYLTRFLCGTQKEQAFAIPLLGAQIVDETDKAIELLKKIRGLDTSSIIAACQLAGYDVAFRRGEAFFTGTQRIKPHKTIVDNIKTMVRRSLTFLERHKPVVAVGFTFEGGYTNLVSTGDGDFLTTDGLWDFKTSQREPTAEDTLQILMYYILGYHSVHPEFKLIETIGVFNPYLFRSYEIRIDDIPEKVLCQVSHDVLGFKLANENSRWYDTDGEDQQVFLDFICTVSKENTDTDFDPNKYEDGIYDISVDDYWTYFRDKSDRDSFRRPKFSRTDHIKFLKNSGFLMFVSVSSKGSTCILQGGSLRKLEKPLEYYYNRMPEYGARILALFSKYWDAIYKISGFVKGIAPREISARVHGCIVDLDFFNHIYLNPLDGTITPYSAESMFRREPYKNLASLISRQMSHLLPAFKKKQQAYPNSLALAEISTPSALIALTDDEVIECNEIVYDTDMYAVSNKLKVLQLIYDYHLIAVWYDTLLSPQKTLDAADDGSASDCSIDDFVSKSFDTLVKILRDERNTSRGEFRFLVIETKHAITQEILFALIRRFIRDNKAEALDCNTVSFGASWEHGKWNYNYVSVDTAIDDILSFYKRLFKPRERYQNSVLFRFEIAGTKKKRKADISVSFVGGNQNPLSLEGKFKYADGKLSLR